MNEEKRFDEKGPVKAGVIFEKTENTLGPTEFITKDSGKREEFSTGAVRDVREGKGRFDLIPYVSLKRLADLLERGGLKYSEKNWQKGMPIKRMLDSLIRHAYQYLDGQRDEDHMAAVMFNSMAVIYYEEQIKLGKLPKELGDL